MPRRTDPPLPPSHPAQAPLRWRDIPDAVSEVPHGRFGQGKTGLPALTALVVGGIIGSGIFSLPQNMAEGAGAARS